MLWLKVKNIEKNRTFCDFFVYFLEILVVIMYVCIRYNKIINFSQSTSIQVPWNPMRVSDSSPFPLFPVQMTLQSPFVLEN